MTSNDQGAVVVGGGPAGLAAALALGVAGVATRLAAPPHRAPGNAPDNRTAALFTGSIEFLRNLGAWDEIRPHSTPIRAIRIIDDTGGLLRAPETLFTAEEVGLEAFGWNVPNYALVLGLTQAARRDSSGVELIETAGVEQVRVEEDQVVLATREGLRLTARLIVAADGRTSICREAAGIASRTWSYPQSALATSFTHTREHSLISTEFHRASGPFTTVPLGGRASSLVWVELPAEAQRLAALDEAALRAAIEERLHGLLGEVLEIGPRAVFPLSGLTAEVTGARRVALVGESAHVIPPIGAQGLNLGLRDGAALADCVARAAASGQDIGSADVLDMYSSSRRLDISSRIYTIDVLNRSLISSLLPVQLARGFGIHLLKAIGPLRRLVIREGLQPSGTTPRLMQPGGRARMGATAA